MEKDYAFSGPDADLCLVMVILTLILALSKTVVEDFSV